MNKLILLFCGDFAPCRRWFDIEPNTNVFGNTIDYIKNSDLAFVNLETPATNIGKPILKDGPNLKTKPEWLRPLKEAGFSLLGLANNHIGDYGKEAVVDCINNCEKINLLEEKENWIATPLSEARRGCAKTHEIIYTVGAGKNLKDSQRIFYFEKNNIKVAIIAVCEHEYGIAEENKAGTAPLDAIDNVRQIQDAKKNADFVIYTIHGGNEYFSYPRPYLRKQCQFYIEQGCDAVICHHPHVPGAYEIYNGKPIFYSLGNFLFDNDKPPTGWNEGYMVKLELNNWIATPFSETRNDCNTNNNVDDNHINKTNHNNHNQIKFELIPYIQSFEQGGIKLMIGSEKDSFLRKIEEYRNTLKDKKKYEKVWNDFCESKKDNYLILQYCPLIIRGIGRLLRKIGSARVLLKSTKRLTGRLNFIRCESHREVLLNILNVILDLRNEP